MWSLTPAERQLRAMGTTANEALHAQFNNSQRPVIQQHAESLDVVLQSFSLSKLLAHHSASFAPTIAQRSQQQILSVMQGFFASSACAFCPPFATEPERDILSRKAVRAPVHAHDKVAATAYVKRLRSQKDRWNLHLRMKPRRTVSKKKKRHVFTKKKKRAPAQPKKEKTREVDRSMSMYCGYCLCTKTFQESSVGL